MTSSRVEPVRVLRPDGLSTMNRSMALETPVAVEVDGLGYAVMMMTPVDLDVFVTGFLLTERLIDTVDDIVDVDAFEAQDGWIVRATLVPDKRGRIHDRVRHRSTDTSCGLCGIAGLEQLRRPVAGTPPRPLAAARALFASLAALRAHQPLNAATGAVHAAAACGPSGAIVGVFEDVGRHNALDKLIGWSAMERHPIDGFILVTSRISFEMVDKTLVAGAPMLVGISAPTTLAIEHARRHGLTLLALARSDAILVVHDPWSMFVANKEMENEAVG